jgi:hypothetical protein
MNTSDLEAAVRLVLPALNLEPSQFHLDRGFLGRAQRSSTPLGISLNTVKNQLVFAGVHNNSDPDMIATSLAAAAFATLSDPIQSVCQRLVVSWANAEGQIFAAAFAVSPTREVGQLLGLSWSPPNEWPEPMIDPQESLDAAFANHLAQLESSVRDRPAAPESMFHHKLKRIIQLIALILQRVGGESQDKLAPPLETDSDEIWSSWLNHFTWSVENEWNRVRGTHQFRAHSVASSSNDGPLKGLKVFLSYARPDAASLAWPVDEALTSCGASVWFDQEQLPDQRQLDAGFSQTIASCDAYIMCASNEFMERAGYATQELAWAIQHSRVAGIIMHLLVVSKAGTILPTAIASWPIIEFNGLDKEGLARNLVLHLSQSQMPRKFSVSHEPQTKPEEMVAPIPLQDIRSLRFRAEHIDRFDAIPQRIVEQIATSDQAEHDQQAMEVRRQLLRVGVGLEWSGTLQDIDRWPNDPLVRDLRLRLASARAVAGTRWPLSGDLDSELGVADDVEYIATHRAPACDWATAPGWDDSARRFALRYHAGLLRLLQGLLRRGLIGGVGRISSSKLDEYADALSTRRRECIDAVLELRFDERLGWRDEPPLWDGIFRAWRSLLTDGNAMWRDPVPFWIIQLLFANATDIAAVGAETCWCASRHPQVASLPLNVSAGFGNSVAVDVYAQPPTTSSCDTDLQNRVRLGLVATPDNGAEIRLEWNGLPFFGESAAGKSCTPAPLQLLGAFNFLRA